MQSYVTNTFVPLTGTERYYEVDTKCLDLLLVINARQPVGFEVLV